MYIATSVVGVPSQPNCAASNCACLFSKNGSSGTVFWNSVMTVPSLGATLKVWLAAPSPPAAGMFCGTTVGLPGMCSPRWRATVRP